jgi:replicative DNA helicase
MTDISPYPDMAPPIAEHRPASKVPPHSMEAERSVLGALMLDPRAWDKVTDLISAEDFYTETNQQIFQAMITLSERHEPIDALTVLEVLRSSSWGEESPQKETYLYELVKDTPSAANVAAYAKIVREHAILRQLVSIGSEISERALQPDSEVKDLLDAAEREVFNIAEKRQRSSGPVDVATLLARATGKMDELYQAGGKISGLETGFYDLDEMTSGLQEGDMVIIAGRPSMGKTAFSMNIAEHAAMNSGKAVLIFSMEMPGESLALRMISSLGRINQHKVRTGQLEEDDWARVTSAIQMLSTKKLFVDDTPALSPIEMRSRARRVARENDGLGLIVIDYLQLMQVTGSKENRTNEISEISRSLKGLAKELNVPVIALSQLNRGLESRTDKRPMMADLRESGAIEQDADLIAFIYRDEVYNPDSPDKGKAEIIIAKQRNGPIGRVMLTFLGEFTRFEDFQHEGFDDGVPV